MRSSSWPSTRSARTTATVDSSKGQATISVPRILSFTSNDWGWWRTVTGNLDKLTAVSSTRTSRRSRPGRRRRRAPSGFDPRSQVDGAAGGHRAGAQVDALEAAGARRRAPEVVRGARGSWPQRADVRIFFATDIHGSDVCWRKFLNAGAFHKADVLIMGGDMTGKAMVPITVGNGSWRVTLQDQEHVLSSEDEVAAMEKRIQRPRLLPDPARPGRVRRLERGPGPRRRAVQGRDARPGGALDGPRRRAARRQGHQAASSRRRTTTSSRSTRSSRPPSSSTSARATSSISRGSRWSRPAGPTRRPGTRSGSCRSRAPGANRRPRRRRARTSAGRSSTSTPRRTARIWTTPRRSEPTCATCPAVRR